MKKSEILSKAIVIATNAHAGQFDRGGRPYILHCLAVLQLLNSDDEELQAIAVLHDSFEDTSITRESLRSEGFSERVISGIMCMTKMPGESYGEYKAKVLSNYDAMRVKAADLTHNSDIRRLKGVTEKDIERMVKYHKFFLEIQDALRNH